MWDSRYDVDEYVYGEEANSFFKEYLLPKPKCRILLPGEGEGRNALYAAQKGYYVHGFDESEVGAGKAVNLARSHGLSIEYQICSVEDFVTPDDYYDAVGLIYLHLPQEIRKEFHLKIKNCLQPGGRIIAELFSKKQLGMNSGGPKNLDLLYSLDEILEDFKEFNIILAEEKQIEISEGNLHNGKAWVIQFVAEKKGVITGESSS